MKKQLTTIGFILILAVGLLTGCGEKKNDKKVLNIAYFPNITHTQALVLKEQKTLENKLSDWTIKWHDFNSGTSEMEAVFAEEIDIGYIGPVPAVSGNVKSNGDVQIIAGAVNGGSMLVAKSDANISTVADLDGKTVAVPSIGNTQHLLLCKLMSENNLKAKTDGGSVNVMAVANGDTQSMMEKGEIDAAFVPEPWGSTLVNKTGASIVLDYDDIWNEDGSEPGGYSTTVVISRKDFLKEHSDVVKEFIAAHSDATDYIANNQENAASIVNAQIKAATGKEIATDILASAFGKIIPSIEIPKSSILKYAEASLEQKLIPAMPEEKSIFNEQ